MALGLLATGVAQAQTPTFAPMAAYLTGTGSKPTRLATADVNGDGQPDLLTANYNTSSVGVLLGNGNGIFQPAATYPTGSGGQPLSLAVADVNNDGKPDLLTTFFNGLAGILLGNGDGTFQAPVTYSTGSSSRCYDVAVADVDGDGKPDLLTANGNDGAAGVLLGNGNGTFRAAITYPTGSGSRPTSLAVADVNGDGRPDLLTTDFTSSRAGVLLNTMPRAGPSNFLPAQSFSTGSGSTPTAWPWPT